MNTTDKLNGILKNVPVAHRKTGKRNQEMTEREGEREGEG